MHKGSLFSPSTCYIAGIVTNLNLSLLLNNLHVAMESRIQIFLSCSEDLRSRTAFRYHFQYLFSSLLRSQRRCFTFSVLLGHPACSLLSRYLIPPQNESQLCSVLAITPLTSWELLRCEFLPSYIVPSCFYAQLICSKNKNLDSQNWSMNEKCKQTVNIPLL